MAAGQDWRQQIMHLASRKIAAQPNQQILRRCCLKRWQGACSMDAHVRVMAMPYNPRSEVLRENWLMGVDG
jgi:hypothetical protein